jgi:hypothetical protein
LLVSYAISQVYEGKIYQVSNWLFLGMTGREAGIMLNGKIMHRRTINITRTLTSSGSRYLNLGLPGEIPRKSSVVQLAEYRYRCH